MRPTLADLRLAAERSSIACVIVVAGVVAGLGAGARVAAHTDIDFTIPTDGAAVGEPVAEITIGFTQAVTLIGPGFEVLDPQGNVLTPFAATDDDQVFRLQLDPPLAGGQAAVRYEVRAQDGHTVAGGFSFTISVDAPLTTTSTIVGTTTSTTSTTVAQATTTSAEPDDGATATTSAQAPATVPTASTAGTDPTDDDGSTGIYLAIAAAVAIGAGAFLVIRSRATTPR